MSGNKKKCKFMTDKNGKPKTENGKRVLMCKTEDGGGPVIAHPNKNGGYTFVPEGSISDEDEARVIKYMKMRLPDGDTEGKTGEW